MTPTKPDEYLLVVGGTEVPAALGPALRGALPVRRCHGPGAIDCPAVRHEQCPLRAEAKATIVYLAGEHEIHSAGRWDCVTAAASPVVAVIGAGSHPPLGRHGFAIVGGETGPIGVLGALALLFDEPDRPEELEPRLGQHHVAAGDGQRSSGIM